ncbi:hypothetical protein ACMBCM_04365, partial [Spiroplasma sp. K1]
KLNDIYIYIYIYYSLSTRFIEIYKIVKNAMSNHFMKEKRRSKNTVHVILYKKCLKDCAAKKGKINK